MVSVALSGVWVMYGRSLAKSGEVIAANSIARSATEGLISNGWEWLKSKETAAETDLQHNVTVERIVRGRKADIKYHVAYTLQFNTGPDAPFAGLGLSPDICRIIVYVRWRSSVGKTANVAGTDDNNEATYSAYFYKHGI